MQEVFHVGLDVGSTTIKIAVLNAQNQLIYQYYARHYSEIQQTVERLLTQVHEKFPRFWLTISVTGSSGIAIAEALQLDFAQEVFVCSQAVEQFIPQTDVAIELGGEDAKITYWGESPELRMNGTCAGGTGAFIDQMAALLKTDAAGLNALAAQYKQIYPIASRCGVFAKSDIQPLLNEGAEKTDIAASIFQAVVNQTIAGLACGKPIRGKVAFLGGPLHFLPELRARFIETLALQPEEIILPANAQYFVAQGAALVSRTQAPVAFADIYARLPQLTHRVQGVKGHLEPLFRDQQDYADFQARHQHQVARANIAEAEGPCFLGIDAGSTTTKLALVDGEGCLLYSFYGNNGGSPLTSTISALQQLYDVLPSKAYLGLATVTGYGEALLKAALKVDQGEIETVAHQRGAEYFLPGSDFILDIGGQDMKCLQVKEGVIHSIMLNEACSSGCGSFIESLARSLEVELPEFIEKGLFSAEPVDLGTRCTVFMNSKIKQVQKEGADIGGIAAGLAYSVVKNALYKVIRLRNAQDLGQRIVVQGGTFYNDAVLRSFERIIGQEVVRPDIAGIMGAYGAALLSKDRYAQVQNDYRQIGEIRTVSTLLPADQLRSFHVRNTTEHCTICSNQCLLTMSTFPDQQTFITGNRCERGSGGKAAAKKLPNVAKYKYQRLFAYRPLKKEEAPRGEIGLPRVLNLYEQYPFWFTFFTQLGFRVVLSDRSSKEIFTKGMETIPSESLCYPAKLANGHIQDLIDKGVQTIFYPCIPREKIEQKNALNNFNCPVVVSYPEAIKVNMDVLRERGIRFLYPFLPLENPARMYKRLSQVFKEFGISRSEIQKALDAAYAEREVCQQDIQKKGQETLAWMEENQEKGIILAGRPYHVDPEINHGIPEMIIGLGLAVLTEDSICHLAPDDYPVQVLNQWVYHSRLYAAAAFAGTRNDLELVQLNSFGCGIDAVTTDQVETILEQNHKTYTLVKIDEINNLGAVRIRIRSLLAAMQEREGKGITAKKDYPERKRVAFTQEMKKDYTILCPQMAPIHFALFQEVLRLEGYHLEVLPDEGPEVVEQGLLHVHNDACYPSILTIGQMMAALKSGRYDLDRTALIMSQTGGGCRASNYIAFIRKALQEAGMEQIPVISANFLGWEKNPGFTISFGLVKKAVLACLFGDLLMKLTYATRPYEAVQGQTNETLAEQIEQFKLALPSLNKGKFKQLVQTAVAAYSQINIQVQRKPKVGVVGEILVKFHPFANNYIVETIEQEGGEAVMPGLTEFFTASFPSMEYVQKNLAGSKKSVILGRFVEKWLDSYQHIAQECLQRSKRYQPSMSLREMARLAAEVIQLGHQTGEGWLLTGEMAELLHSGVDNIACLQPFACLPNHIVGKGMIRELRRHYPRANIVPLDFDPGASQVNLLNRIKLMMSVAQKNLSRSLEEEAQGKGYASDRFRSPAYDLATVEVTST